MDRPPEPRSFDLPSPGPPPGRPATQEAERRIGGGAGRDELAVRLRQQAILSDFGGFALGCRDHDVLLQRAAELCAEGLNTEFAKVLEWEADEQRLRVRAGVGWAPGVVGRATVGADLESPAGYAFQTGTPVISNHLAGETRFRTPQLLLEHGVRRAMNVPVRAGTDQPIAVLEVDSTDEGRFEEADLSFLQNFANLLGVVVERERAEADGARSAQALRASEERFRLASRATTDAIWDWDLATGEIVWSEAMQFLSGYEVKPTLQWWKDHLHPDDRERVIAGLYAAIEGDAERWSDEYRFRRSDDGYAEIYDRGFVVRDAEGRPVRMIGGMLDVTERKMIEAELHETQERLDTALAAAELGTWDYDLASGTLRWDERCKALFGLPPDATMSYAQFLECVHAEDRAAVDASVRAALDPDGPGTYDIEMRAAGASSDGGARWIVSRGRVVFRSRKAVRMVGAAFDISHRKKVERLMQEALDHQSMLAREVSHRVKNSLQLVAGVLALQARSAKQEEVREALTAAQNRVQTIGQIHDQLWRQLDVQEVDLATFLGSLCEKLQESAFGHRLEFHGAPTPISTDRAIPVALLVNELVTNAFKHAYPDTPGEVCVSLAADGDRLTLEVADYGVGLPPGAEEAAQNPDSLGMKVVAGLVRQLRAELEVRSNAPGARFVLSFDRAEPEAAVDREPESTYKR